MKIILSFIIGIILAGSAPTAAMHDYPPYFSIGMIVLGGILMFGGLVAFTAADKFGQGDL